MSADKLVEVRQILLSRIIRTKDPPQLKFPYARAVDIDSVLWSLQKIHNMGIITIGGFAYECINKRDEAIAKVLNCHPERSEGSRNSLVI